METKVTFQRVAGTGTPAPDGSTFISFEAPTVFGGMVAFRGRTSGGNQGVYCEQDGQFYVIADNNTAVPGGRGQFTTFAGVPALHNARVAFEAAGAMGQSGIYLAGESLEVVIDTSSTLPNGKGRFTGFGQPSLDSSSVVFRGTGTAGQTGIYRYDGELHVVADTGTNIPDGNGRFTSFGNPAADDDAVAFVGSGMSNQQGIVLFHGDEQKILASRQTPVPEGSGTFTNFGDPSLRDHRVAFLALGGDGKQGAYKYFGGLSAQADQKTGIPDGRGSFIRFRNVSLEGERVVFLGEGNSDQQGVYCSAGPSLMKIVDRGDRLDDKSAQSFALSLEAQSGPRVAFVTTFDDGSQAVYVAILYSEELEEDESETTELPYVPTSSPPPSASTSSEPPPPLQPTTGANQHSLLAVFEAGQTVAMKDVGERYEITLHQTTHPDTGLTVGDIGPDYLLVRGTAGNFEVRVPVWSIKAIVIRP